MKKHRGLFLGLGLAALVAVAAPEAQAGPVTITLSWGSGASAQTLSFNATTLNTGFAGSGSTSDSLNANIGALNSYLAAHGSAYSFVSLGASSNNPGALSGATVGESGAVKVSNPNGATNLTIVASQDQFTSPTGAATLASASSATFGNATAGDNQRSNSSFNTATTTPPLTYTASGAPVQAFSGQNSLGGLTATSAGYTLDATTTINMSLAGLGHATDRFSTTGVLTAVPIPEPSALIIMVTGMPLPLVMMGLLRRRRAAA